MNVTPTTKPADIVNDLIKFVAGLSAQRRADVLAHGDSDLDADYILDELDTHLDNLRKLHG